jgi:peptidoglycan/LPS O-acetylase OafA/YrhL
MTGPATRADGADPAPDSARPAGLLPYLAGLDGIRAVAVAGVLAYHGGAAAYRGGFLGVEVFFVLSGYLITALLLGEWDRNERIALGPFWIRRARRLLPALFAFLAGTTLLAALVASDALAKIREGFLSAVFYVANWGTIARGESYGDAFDRPSFLAHLWSLAVEEQFYLLWPLLLAAGLRYLGRRWTLRAVVAGWALSTAWMWWLANGLADFADPSRIYLGTDTRAAGLLMGAAVAFLWRPWTAVGAEPRWRSLRNRMDLLGLAGVLGILFLFRTAEFSATPTPGQVAWLYPWGFVATGVATLAVVVAVTTPGSRAGRVLGNRAFRAVGVRSYAIYLWHFPVFAVTRPRVDVTIEGFTLWVVRLGSTAVLTELSYRLVERPVREKRFLAGLAALRTAPPRRLAAQAAGALVGVLLVVGGLQAIAIDHDETVDAVAAPATSSSVPAPGGSASTSAPTETGGTTTPTAGGSSSTGSTEATASTLQPGVSEVEVPATSVAEALSVTPTYPPGVTFIGDSVLLGASPELQARMPTAVVDAHQGRQWWEAAADLRTMAAEGRLTSHVVLHLGNNGTLTDELFDEVMAALAGVERVSVLTVRVPREWEGTVNDAIWRADARYPNVDVIDWRSLSDGHPEYFGSDGVHVGSTGRVAYADFVLAAVAG